MLPEVLKQFSIICLVKPIAENVRIKIPGGSHVIVRAENSDSVCAGGFDCH